MGWVMKSMLVVAGISSLNGCVTKPADSATREKTTGGSEGETSGPFAKDILREARNYQNLARATTSQLDGIDFCNDPPVNTYMALSDAGPKSEHTHKLYHLWVRDYDGYIKSPDKPASIRQVLIKESFEAIPRKEGEDAWDFIQTKKGIFNSGARKELFVMLKLNSSTPGTDEGWVYGTVAPDLSRTLHSGRLQSCMECHTKRPSRMFGLKMQ